MHKNVEYARLKGEFQHANLKRCGAEKIEKLCGNKQRFKHANFHNKHVCNKIIYTFIDFCDNN